MVDESSRRDPAYRENTIEREMIARGKNPYCSDGRLIVKDQVLPEEMKEREQRGYEEWAAFEKYDPFYQEVVEIGIETKDIKIETMGRLLEEHFPERFGLNGQIPLREEGGEHYIRRTRGAFMGVLDTARKYCDI